MAALQAPLIDSDDHTDSESLELALNKLESFLRLFGFCQYSSISTALSWVLFFVIGVIVPVLLIVFPFCSDCSEYQIKRFEFQILVSQAVVAAISLFFVSHNLRKYGVRKLLFVDQYDGYAVMYQKLYIQKIYVSFYFLILCDILCFNVWLCVT